MHRAEGWRVMLDHVLQRIVVERRRQDEKWGEQNHTPDRWLVILGEEVGEACKVSLEGQREHYRHELIHVAAVAVAAIESSLREETDDAVEHEREEIRQHQASLVMPLIGRLLDAWEDLPNDVRGGPELSRLAGGMQAIDSAMEDDNAKP